MRIEKRKITRRQGKSTKRFSGPLKVLNVPGGGPQKATPCGSPLSASADGGDKCRPYVMIFQSPGTRTHWRGRPFEIALVSLRTPDLTGFNQMFHVKHLFSDTEVSEDDVEDILDVHFPYKSPQRLGCQPKLFSDDIFATPIASLPDCPMERIYTFRQR
jgi:hypothetical protein